MPPGDVPQCSLSAARIPAQCSSMWRITPRLSTHSTRRVVCSRGLSATDAKLSSEAVLILTSLADGPKHGYAIQQDIARVAGRELGPGSLYGSIARLESAGYIKPLEID